MPARTDRIAPVFNSQQPRDLRRYFNDLDFLLSRSHITDDFEKKFHTTRFLSLNDQELWELVPEFADPAASFEQFTAAIFRLYPEANPDRRYSIADLDALVTAHSRITPYSRASFLEFCRRFLLISAYLRTKNRLSAHEQSLSFIRSIPPRILPHVQQRLCIRCPDIHPHDPYPLADLRDAIDLTLLNSTAPSVLPAASLELSESGSLTPARSEITALIETIKALTQLIASQQQSPVALHSDSQPFPSPRPGSCSYCSDPAHFIARCPIVAADLRSGFCRRNAEGKVVLPSGMFVPHRTVGPNLRARI
ncbi:hypothetical protein K438DRAFT_1579517, partial [Mycena galopus ATCC 62051]